jgi:hypothetical protein
MKQPHRDDQAQTMLDALIDEITVDDHADDEKLWAFRQAFEDHLVVTCDAFVIGEPVSVIAFEYDGNERRGLTARCRRASGAEHLVMPISVAWMRMRTSATSSSTKRPPTPFVTMRWDGDPLDLAPRRCVESLDER